MFTTLVRLAALVCLLIPNHAAAQSFAPAGWDAAVKLLEPVDRNPDPRIVEIDLVAELADFKVDGHTVRAWTYNGGVPGPLIARASAIV